MISISFSKARNRFRDYCNKATDEAETVVVTRGFRKNVVIISESRYEALRKAERNAAYLRKLESGLAQVHAGEGIVKTMDELEAMETDAV